MTTCEFAHLCHERGMPSCFCGFVAAIPINLNAMKRVTISPTDRISNPAIAYGYITRHKDVRGGNAIVAGTRIGVHDVIGLLQNGETVDTIVSRCFPDLTRAQVYECLAYYEDHRGEIDVLVARQMSVNGTP
jgi:uncharacterized protein (DUF433 family)